MLSSSFLRIFSQISNFAVNIVVTLLLGRLSMPSQAWQNFIYSITPVLPQLQCFASMDKALGRALATISDSSNALLGSDGESYSLPPLEQLRASLRFMFVKDDSIRARGFSSIIWTLSQEDIKSGSTIRYSDEDQFCPTFRVNDCYLSNLKLILSQPFLNSFLPFFVPNLMLLYIQVFSITINFFVTCNLFGSTFLEFSTYFCISSVINVGFYTLCGIRHSIITLISQ